MATEKKFKTANKRIVLASGSPRRIEMMKAHGYDPVIMPAHIDEELPYPMNYRDAVMFLSLKKALWVMNNIDDNEDSIIIAADTVVYKDRILGKPEDRQDAEKMLKAIRGTEHYVATGVTIIDTASNVKDVFCDVTQVMCKDYSDRDIEDYLNTDEPYDKAGAYAIQGIFSKHIDHYVGSYDTVVGFPWELIEGKLDR